MSVMFQFCSELQNLDLSGFNTSNVTDMRGMFNYYNKSKEIKGLNKFITKKVIDMSEMFQYCFELEHLDLTNFDLSNVNNISRMFNECKKLY